jgi:hypothetical protein
MPLELEPALTLHSQHDSMTDHSSSVASSMCRSKDILPVPTVHLLLLRQRGGHANWLRCGLGTLAWQFARMRLVWKALGSCRRRSRKWRFRYDPESARTSKQSSWVLKCRTWLGHELELESADFVLTLHQGLGARALSLDLKVPASASSPTRQLARGVKSAIRHAITTHFFSAPVPQLFFPSECCSLSSCSIGAA